MKRRSFIDALGKGAAAAYLAPSGFWRIAEASAPFPAGNKPNVILILADDLGYNDIGIQGCPDIPTPSIDSIGRNGVRFTHGYVSCPLCAPTRAGLMTGRYQQRFGLEFNPGSIAAAPADYGLPLEEATIAERMKKLGYATGMFGKWHLGFNPRFHPMKRGFDEFFGFLGGAHSYLPGSGQMNDGRILRGMEPFVEKEYLTDALAREAVAFIDRHKGEPFFLYLPFNAVHAPMEATEKYLSRFKDIKNDLRRTHAAMLSALDDAVGTVLARLRQHGLEGRTLIFFLGDNGGPTFQTTSNNAPLRGFKSQALEGGIRIPFLMQWKGTIPAGKTDDRPVISLDIHPTAVAAGGGTLDPSWKLDGIDLLPYLSGAKNGPPHDSLFWRMGRNQRAVRQGNLKLVWSGPLDLGGGLYDVVADPGEGRNLSAEKPEDLKRLQGLFESWNGQLIEPRWPQTAPAGQRPGAPGAKPAQGGQQVPPIADPNVTMTDAQLKQWFSARDRNGDGKLTPQEFPRPVYFRLIDTNGDGVITFDELKAFYLKTRK